MLDVGGTKYPSPGTNPPLDPLRRFRLLGLIIVVDPRTLRIATPDLVGRCDPGEMIIYLCVDSLRKSGDWRFADLIDQRHLGGE